MRLSAANRSQYLWTVWTAVALLVAGLGYYGYVLRSPTGPSGGSVPGISLGVAGYVLILIAALLGLRKKIPDPAWPRLSRWRLGRVYTWMQGHLWLGFLSYPLILLHAGFHLGGFLTCLLMLIFTLVVITGVTVAVLQHRRPRQMTTSLPLETIYNDINYVQTQLVKKAGLLLKPHLIKREKSPPGTPEPGLAPLMATTAVAPAEGEEDDNRLLAIFESDIKPYLLQRGAYDHELNDGRTSRDLFRGLRKGAPPSLVELIEDLEDICEEKRDFDRQLRLHWLLNRWLIVHVPLSVVLIVLGGIHAVMALRYG